jgi:hypothetical protein
MSLGWLRLGLIAGGAAYLLALTSIMHAAFAFGDDTALVMGRSGFRYRRLLTWTPLTAYSFSCPTGPSIP